jgi:hypothetical protein
MRTPQTPLVAVEFRMAPEQRESLKAEAQLKGISMQQLIELKVFGELRPHLRGRHVVSEGQQQLTPPIEEREQLSA